MTIGKWIPAAVLVAVLPFAGCGSDASGPSGDPVWMEKTVDGFTLGWLAGDSILQMELTGPTTGWVAAGLDPSFMMQDADFIIGYVAGSTAFARDDWGNAPTSHRADTLMGGTDDILTLGGSEAAGATTIAFSIPMDSGDPYDKALERGASYTVILARGPDAADDFSTQHEFVTTTTIQLQ